MWIREIVIVENIRLGRLRWEFIKENKNSTKKATKKKNIFFLITFLVEFLFDYFIIF